MRPEEVDLWADALILKINAITGWTTPAQTALTVFTDLFKKKIILSYSNCNPDEIEYAFLQYGTQVKDWGKSMNLSLIDEVIIPYLERRFEVSKIEEQQKKPKMLENKEDMDNDLLWNTTEELVKKGAKLFVIPDNLYNWMESNGNILITSEEKKKYWERACMTVHAEIVNDFEANSNNATRDLLSRFNKVRETKQWDNEPVLKERIRNMAKKMVIYDMMKAKI